METCTPFLFSALAFILLLPVTVQVHTDDDCPYCETVTGHFNQKYCVPAEHSDNSNLRSEAQPIPEPPPRLMDQYAKYKADNRTAIQKYSDSYREYNDDYWYQMGKMVLPLAGGAYIFGMMPVINIATLSLTRMYVMTQTVAAIFNTGNDIGNGLANYINPVDPRITMPISGQASREALGHVAGGLFMGTTDLAFDLFYHQHVPDLSKMTVHDARSRFLKSVAVTGKLNKAAVAQMKSQLMRSYPGLGEEEAEALAEGAINIGLITLLSVSTRAGIIKSDLSRSFVSDDDIIDEIAGSMSKAIFDEAKRHIHQGKPLASEAAREGAKQLRKAMDSALPDVHLTTEQKLKRYGKEEMPRAASVTAAYQSFEAAKKACKVALKRMDIGTSGERETTCLGIISIASMGVSYLSLREKDWIQPGFLRVYVENLGEAGGLGITQISMELAGLFAEYMLPGQPFIRDTARLAAGGWVFSTFYGFNVRNPSGDYINNARSGAALIVILEGTEILMSHSVPFIVTTRQWASDYLIPEALRSFQYNHLNKCFQTPQAGMSTDVYNFNNDCYE